MSRLLPWCVLCVSGAALAQGPSLDISGATFKPLPLAIAKPLAQDEGAKARAAAFDEALSFDLSACGLFTALERKSFLAKDTEGITAGSINFRSWADVGADALVKTQLSVDGETLRGDVRLFTVASGKEELKESASVPLAEAHRLAHKLANAVYKFYTRETGPFETHLTFTRKTPGGKDVLWSGWDGRDVVVVGSGGINVIPALAPDGLTVGFTSYRRGKPELFTSKPGGTPAVLVGAGRMATGVAFSPDGKRIAYALSDGEGSQLFVAAADGSNPRQLTNSPYIINSSPAWSPDGKRLAFVSNRGGSPQIYVMSAEGGEAKRLTFQGNYNQTPDWSPRGDLIAFTARDERNAFDLFTVNVESGKVQRLTQDQGNNEEPAFSPNGRLLVFTSTRGGTPALYVMTADGNNQLPLPAEKGSYATPDWGP